MTKNVLKDSVIAKARARDKITIISLNVRWTKAVATRHQLQSGTSQKAHGILLERYDRQSNIYHAVFDWLVIRHGISLHLALVHFSMRKSIDVTRSGSYSNEKLSLCPVA